MGSLTKDEGYKAGKDMREDILREREAKADKAEAAEKRRREAERDVALDHAIASRADEAERTNTIRLELGLGWKNPRAFAMGMQYGLPLSFTRDGKRLPSPLAIAANKLNAEDLRPRLLMKLPAPLPELPEERIAGKRTRTYSG